MISDTLKESLSDWEVIEFIDNTSNYQAEPWPFLAWNDSMDWLQWVGENS